MLRNREYKDFILDPVGEKVRQEIEDEKSRLVMDPFVANLKFIEKATTDKEEDELPEENNIINSKHL